MATIKALKTKLEDGTEQVVFPKTLPEAIIDPETNETLDVILNNLNEKIDNIEPGGGGGGGTTYELSRADDTITLTGGDGSSSEVDVSDKVSKSGDTMTGALEISNGSFPALVLKHTGKDGGTTAGMQFENSNGVLGGIGMPNKGNELRRWNKDLTTSYEILDSGNYSNYALPKTGGKITGGLTVTDGFYSTGEQTVLYQDYYCFQCSDGAGKEGYWKLCTINVTGTYADAPILFYMSSRGHAGKVAIRFNAGSNVSATSLNSLSRESGINSCYVIKTSGTSSGSVFDVYVKKEVPWGNLTVNHLEFPKYMRDLMTLTWSGTYVASLPSGTTEATAYTILNTTNYSSNIPSATQSAVGLMSAADKKKLDYLKITANTDVGADDYSANAIGYVMVNLFGQSDAALYKQVYSDKWIHEIAGDYRTGQLAVRGKNNGTWQSWRTVLDSGNYSSYALPKAGGTLTGAVKYGSYNMLEYNSTSTTVSNTNRPNMYFGNDNTRTVLRGQVYINNPGVAPCTQVMWAVISDARLKENIIDLTSTDDIKSKYIQLWDKVNPMEYNLTYNSNKKNLGYVAQDFIEAMEELDIDYEESSIVNIQPNEQIGEDGICSVSENSEYFEELYTLNYDECAMLTTLKVKQIVNEILPNMQAEIDALKEQNELLKEQIRLMKEGN